MKQTEAKVRILRPALTGAFFGLLIAIAFVCGFYVRDLFPAQVSVPSVPSDDAGFPLVDEVQTLLDQIYLREQPSYTERQYAAIRGLLAGLDDSNTFFIDPPVAQSEADVLAGTYGGIGVLVNREASGAFVLYPFADSPAEAAGIAQGAILLAIDGEAITPDAQPDAIDQMLRGEVTEGNGVTLELEQDGSTEEIFVAFDVINVPSVVWRVLDEDERIGYIQILRFTARTPEELTTGLTELLDNDITGLILDMRDNTGGLLDASLAVADEFLDNEPVIFEVTANAEQQFDTSRGGLATDVPLVVLVNDFTASASELVAGAIQDNERGILIGQRTFGKGTVQQIFTLSDGSSVHITSAEWLTPSRTPIAEVGLIPDIEMIPDENGRDVEIGEAIRYLQATLQ
ncbi:MAG: S41 family peptidase [Chloroflexota bacterium]